METVDKKDSGDKKPKPSFDRSATVKLEKAKEKIEEYKKKSQAAYNVESKKEFGMSGMLKFTFPRIWTGGIYKKFIVIVNVMMVILMKGTMVYVPLLLREVIDSIICVDPSDVADSAEAEATTAGRMLAALRVSSLKDGECPSESETYLLIGIYVGVKFIADFLNYIREIPFANMAATAEISIAHDVYDHVQRQSLAFHLGRETGKIIRIVSRGSQSFSSILRMMWYNFAPMLTEITLTLIVFATIFSWQFLLVQFGAIFLYLFLTYNLTEWRRGQFTRMAKADQNYNQKATDSLLNFETVKYFNAERHEEERFEIALAAYKHENIKTARGLVALNVT